MERLTEICKHKGFKILCNPEHQACQFITTIDNTNDNCISFPAYLYIGMY